MRNFMKYILIGALIGLSMSYTIITINILFGAEGFTTEVIKLNYFISLMLGVGCGLVSLIFSSEKLPILLNLVIHYFGILGLVLLSGWMAEWYSTMGEALIIVGIQFVIYLAVWGMLYFITHEDVASVNKALNKR